MYICMQEKWPTQSFEEPCMYVYMYLAEMADIRASKNPLCMYTHTHVYIQTYTCTHTYICTCTYTYINTCIHTHKNTRTYTYTYIYTYSLEVTQLNNVVCIWHESEYLLCTKSLCVCMYVCMCGGKHVCIQLCVYMYIIPDVYVYIYMYTYTQTHTYIYRYTHIYAYD